MNKLFITLLFLAIAAGGTWYVRHDQRLKASSDRPAFSIETEVGSSSVSEAAPIKNAAIGGDSDLLAAEALKIISRPVLAEVQLSDAVKKQAVEKIKELSKLIEGDFNYINAWYDLGAYRKLIGDYGGAIEAYGFVIRIRPKDDTAHANLGDLYGFYLKDYDKAEKSFLAAISINPVSVSAYDQLATLYESGFKEGVQGAEKFLLSGVSSNPRSAPLKILLAQYYERHGKKSDALRYFKEALELNPGNQALRTIIENLSN